MMDQYPRQVPSPNSSQPAPTPPVGAYPPGQPGASPQAGVLSHLDQIHLPRKSRTGVWIAILIVIVLLIGGGSSGAYFFIRYQNSPTGTLQKFCDGLKNLNAQEVSNTFSRKVQSYVSSQVRMQDLFTTDKANHVTFESCTVSNVKQNGSTATGKITLTISLLNGKLGTYSSSRTEDLVQENGQWKINNNDSTFVLITGS
jgi:flagellar basal body-associated protein FliL